MIYKVGDTLGAYRLLHNCGCGAYGQVFLAKNTFSGQRVALKMISRQGRGMERELQGLMRYRSCRHENLLVIHHVEQTEELLYYTMDAADALASGSDEYCPDTLANRLHLHGTLPESEVCAMAVALSNGLAALHQAGLVHRDVKPDNILWVGNRPVLGDIGLVASEVSVSLAGTPGFLSPGLLTGERRAAPRDDFYALGKVIYCALSGNAPGDFPRFPPGIRLSGSPPLLSVLLAAVSAKGIGSADEFQALLTSPRRRRKRFGIVIGIGVLAGVLGCLGLWSLLPFTPEMPPESHLKIPDIPAEAPRHKLDAAWDRSYNSDSNPYEKVSAAIPDFLRDPEWIDAMAVFDMPSMPIWPEEFCLAKDYLLMLRDPNVAMSKAGDIGIFLPGASTESYANQAKVLAVYEQSYHPAIPEKITVGMNVLFRGIRFSDHVQPEQRQELHEKFLSNPYYQLLLLEIHLRRAVYSLMTVPDDSAEPQSNWNQQLERFERYVAERRTLLNLYDSLEIVEIKSKSNDRKSLHTRIKE